MKITKKIILFLIISILTLILIVFFYSSLVIYRGVKTSCLKAQNKYKKDCINSLIKYIRSDDNTFTSRNSAIWALGQLADKKTLPFLYELDKTLPQQQKCSYDKCLSQYEIKKAIKWCEKGNVTNWMYRNRENWR